MPTKLLRSGNPFAVFGDPTITVFPTDSTATINGYLTQLSNRSDLSRRWILQFAPGLYDLTGVLGNDTQPLVNVLITSAARDATSVNLNKGPSWGSDEYIFEVGYGRDIEFSYLTLTGNHVYNPLDDTVHWTDQGSYFASCHDTWVHHNRYIDIGNAAVRHNTHKDDPITGVNSWNHFVDDNTLSNCWQITTTQDNSLTHGGSRNWWFRRNTITNLRGSIKYATRTAGATGAHILDNTWNSSSGQAMELVSVSDVEVRRNTFNNLSSFICNAYTNDQAGITSFAWGSDLVFDSNVSNTTQQGLRFNFGPYADAFVPSGQRITINDNDFTNVTIATGGLATCRVGNGTIDDVDVTNNDFVTIVNNALIDFAGCTNVTISGNTKDGVPYP